MANKTKHAKEDKRILINMDELTQSMTSINSTATETKPVFFTPNSQLLAVDNGRSRNNSHALYVGDRVVGLETSMSPPGSPETSPDQKRRSISSPASNPSLAVPETTAEFLKKFPSTQRKISSPNNYCSLQITDISSVPTVDSPTAVALEICRKKVLAPYNKFLLFVGWVPFFSYPTNCFHKAVNILHPILVICFILLGYIIQYAGCFTRYKVLNGYVFGWIEVDPASSPNINTSSGMMNLTSATIRNRTGCEEYAISQFVVPDILHSIGYAYSFYALRISEKEHLPTLMERVFLQASLTTVGVKQQGRLIYMLRCALILSVIWVVSSQAAQFLHVFSQFHDLHFMWMEPHTMAGKIIIILMMLASFLFLDVVYCAVVLNYCVQCILLIFYIRHLLIKILEKHMNLDMAIKEIETISGHMRVLNEKPGVAVSIVLVNFATLSLLGTLSILLPQHNSQHQDAFMITATLISVLLWVLVIITPIMIAAVLTSKCAWLRKVGHTTRMRPFGYECHSLQELDSFLLYTATLTLSAKVFLIPVRGASVATVFLLGFGGILALFQTGIWRVHI